MDIAQAALGEQKTIVGALVASALAPRLRISPQ
jgi:hypothetical protein